MSVSNAYQTQPDGYVRFDWRGNAMEGEFFRDDSFNNHKAAKSGYIRPFSPAIRQQLIDNLQIAHDIDLQKFISLNDLIPCDAFVTSKGLQASHQIVIEQVDFIAEAELSTDKQLISSCRVDLLRRQYLLGSRLNVSEETLDSINAEFLIWVTPFYTPLRYERKWHHRILRSAALAVLAVIACVFFS